MFGRLERQIDLNHIQVGVQIVYKRAVLTHLHLTNYGKLLVFLVKQKI